jgi:uncharacterized LabA/DUF88 family protein
MLFVDGENLTVRGQEFASKNNLALKDGPRWKKDAFLWMPNTHPIQRPHCMSGEIEALEFEAIRAYYYTSVIGSHDDLENAEISLRNIGFAPNVFKKPSSDRKSKGVDIALATDMLTHAFQNHLDVAILLGGDADYCPLVNRVKSLGKQVWVWFFTKKEDGRGPALWKSSDVFIPLDSLFANSWPA